MSKNSGIDGAGQHCNWSRKDTQQLSAYCRKCPQCGRKSAISKKIEVDNGIVIISRWCRWCGYYESDVHKLGE